jgi:DNA N-6-adenine-methyltransferase (Dam)
LDIRRTQLSSWETEGKSDDWYTPKYIFDAMACRFDLDVAAPPEGPRYVPTSTWISENSLQRNWGGWYIWMNPPFGGRNDIKPWMDKFFKHRNGVALMPDRTSSPWFFEALMKADAMLIIRGRVKFERPDGTIGKSPGTGTVLMSSGRRGFEAIQNAERNGLGILVGRFGAPR